MKLDGRNRIVYECDNAVKNKTAECVQRIWNTG